jgi:hypothetical protein
VAAGESGSPMISSRARRVLGLFGLALSTLFRQSAMAIGLGLAYALVVEVLIFGLLGGLGGDIVKQIQQWFPMPTRTTWRSRSGRSESVASRGKQHHMQTPHTPW